jgi:drug/metabolite transporter (DMT)-like permease
LIGRGKLRHELARTGPIDLLVAVIAAISTAMFIAAFKATTIANVALIYAAAPMLTAFLAWVILRESMARSWWSGP